MDLNTQNQLMLKHIVEQVKECCIECGGEKDVEFYDDPCDSSGGNFDDAYNNGIEHGEQNFAGVILALIEKLES